MLRLVHLEVTDSTWSVPNDPIMKEGFENENSSARKMQYKESIWFLAGGKKQYASRRGRNKIVAPPIKP